MKLILTAGELIDLDVWATFCKARGINVYAVAEGRMREGEEFVLTIEEAREIGIELPPAGAAAIGAEESSAEGRA